MGIQEQIQNLIPADFPEESKIWIYQSSRPFSAQQTIEIKEQLKQFYLQWRVHGKDLKGWADLLFNRFIVFMADESDFPVSGCSIDSTVRILKSIERQYEARLFDRLTLTFWVREKAEPLPLNQIQYALDKGYITEETLLFNNLVGTREELIQNWLQPLSKSWLAPRLKFGASENQNI